MEDNLLLFQSLINKKLVTFIEKQLNGIWDFMDFYEAYCMTISVLGVKDFEIERKLRLANYYNYGAYVDALKITKREYLTESQFLLKVKGRAEQLRKDVFIKLKEYINMDNRIISNFLSKFSEAEIPIEIMEGSGGKFTVGVIEQELEWI